MIDTLCLSGGGIKGLAFISAIDHLSNIKYIDLNIIKNYVGTSIGAIICFLLSIKYTPVELKHFIINFNFNYVNQKINISNILLHYGFIDGHKYIFILKKFLENKYNILDITFNDHYLLTNNKLTIIGTNFTKGTEKIFDYINTPNMSILLAIRISISIPIIFTPIFYEDEYYIDGGVTNNFPLKYCIMKNTIAIYIKNNINNKLNNVMSLMMGCCNILFNTISLKDNIKTLNIIEILLEISDINIINVNNETKNLILSIGHNAAIKYISNISYNICNNIINDIINDIF
uniref:PNPLA domain-containing protein n=1 Tax=viral metagenome TaxID=1070528 RepID=A0A6C0H8Y7_9ZZZZ